MVQITRHPTEAKAYLLTAAQSVPRSIEETFEFFADPFNLEAITPEWLHFSIVDQGPIEMRAGTTIDYRLRLHGIPLRWRSEITRWEPPVIFVDEQRRGPYHFWHHEHHFESHEHGTRVIDRVSYGVPGGALSQCLLVRRDVQAIFEFRRDKLAEFLS